MDLEQKGGQGKRKKKGTGSQIEISYGHWRLFQEWAVISGNLHHGRYRSKVNTTL
jgi:hypothetical protein